MDTSDVQAMHQEVSTEQHAAYLRVNTGRFAGQMFPLPPNKELHCGTDIDNDIIIPGDVGPEWQVRLLREEITVRLYVLDGTVQMNDLPLTVTGEYVIDESCTLVAEEVEFSLVLPEVANDLQQTERSAPASESVGFPLLNKLASDQQGLTKLALYGFSVVCVVFGVMSAMYAVTGSLILVNADTNMSESNFMEVIGTSELSHLQVEQIEESNKFIVDGAVETREEKNLLTRIAEVSNADLVVNVRVNDEVAESIEDIFRVNGIQAEAEIMADGLVKIHSRTADTDKLEDLRTKVRRDLPNIAQFEIINTEPAVEVVEPKGKFQAKPEKRITLISAGENAYIMTHDKSRYFVGGLLPSGHLIEAIEEGEVIVTKNGKTETLTY